MNRRDPGLPALPGWPERILGGVVAVTLVALGFIFGLVILALVAVAGVVVAGRIWWLRRRLLRAVQQAEAQQDTAESASGRVVQGEYRVLEGERERGQGRRAED
jgi:hypothetical protein